MWTDFGKECNPEELGLDSEGLMRLRRLLEGWVAAGQMPMASALVARKGKVAFWGGCGEQNPGKPLAADTIYRIYSMTKPITSVAIMMLVQEGKIHLDQPLHQLLGDAWKAENMKVWAGGKTKSDMKLVPCERDVTIFNLLTHTSGLTYGFAGMAEFNPVCGIYEETMGRLVNGVDSPEVAAAKVKGEGVLGPFSDLKSLVDTLSTLPLCFQPCTKWHYGLNCEVLGRIVEVVSGQSLGEFFKARIFEPLGMVDTGFFVPESKKHRFANVRYSSFFGGSTDITEELALNGDQVEGAARPECGGGGLVSTTSDYIKFAQCMINGGIDRNGVRLLSRSTVEYMVRNHLPNGADMFSMALPGYSEIFPKGTGFGLGFSVVLDPVPSRDSKTIGTFGWGGLAGTVFHCNPQEDLVFIFMTQNLGLDPSVRVRLSNVLAGCVVDGKVAPQVTFRSRC